jgi:tRNA A-37 threonylcarbamoyl transferase component Bud32
MSTYDSQTGRLAPQVLLQQRYMIIGQAGRGGMGAVYEAMDTHFGQRRVAIKEMSQGHLNNQELASATAQFQQEARLLGSLTHPNLPHILGAFNERGRSYLVMDFIDGKTLHQMLRAQPGKPLPLEQVIHYASQLCNVLSYLHQQRPPIIFRDVKPSNVMVTEKGHVYLIDFGIARIFTEGKEQDTIQLGSPGYAPPEQHGSSQTGPRSDIYGLGATLHYCLTGKDPYYSQEHFTFTPIRQLNPQVPVEMERLVQRMLSLDIHQRPANANEVLQALQSLGQRAADHTIAIHADAGAPTLYQPPQVPAAYPQLVPPPAQLASYQAGQQMALDPTVQPASMLSSFWNARFTTTFFLVALISIGAAWVVMGLIAMKMLSTPVHYYYGYAWLLGACLTGIASLLSFVSCLWTRQALARLVLLLTGLFTLISTACTLILAFPDLQQVLSLRYTLPDLSFVSPLSLALAAFCSLGWMFLASPWSARIFLLLFSAVTLACTLFAANTVSTANPPGQEAFSWYLFFLAGVITYLLNITLAARLSQLATPLPAHTADEGGIAN